MFISEVMTTAPQDERGALETKTYQELERLNIKYERVDNDTVEAMDECVEISEKLVAEIRKTACEQEVRFKALCRNDAYSKSFLRFA